MSPLILAGRDLARGTSIEVTVEGESISRLRDLPEAATSEHQWVLPGLVDIQVNGFAGTDFNQPDLDAAGVGRVVRCLQAVGVTRFCPTICTQSHERMVQALRTTAEACLRERWIERGVAGIHLEGPYISSEDGPRGAHPPQHVRLPDWNEFEAFQRAAGGRIRILTLAPELPGAIPFVRQVAACGVVVSIGHTGASPEILREAIAAGARLSTHLGNASHAVLPRYPNYIWEQLAADELSASIIVDGHHLPPSVVKAFVRTKGVGRTILISDAVGLVGMPPGDYDWLGLPVTLTAERRISLTGTPYLAGSALDLVAAMGNVMTFAGVALADAVTMASTNPARLLNIEISRLAPGSRADLIVIRRDPASGRLAVVRTVVAGALVWEADSAG